MRMGQRCRATVQLIGGWWHTLVVVLVTPALHGRGAEPCSVANLADADPDRRPGLRVDSDDAVVDLTAVHATGRLVRRTLRCVDGRVNGRVGASVSAGGCGGVCRPAVPVPAAVQCARAVVRMTCSELDKRRPARRA